VLRNPQSRWTPAPKVSPLYECFRLPKPYSFLWCGRLGCTLAPLRIPWSRRTPAPQGFPLYGCFRLPKPYSLFVVRPSRLHARSVEDSLEQADACTTRFPSLRMLQTTQAILPFLWCGRLGLHARVEKSTEQAGRLHHKVSPLYERFRLPKPYSLFVVRPSRLHARSVEDSLEQAGTPAPQGFPLIECFRLPKPYSLFVVRPSRLHARSVEDSLEQAGRLHHNGYSVSVHLEFFPQHFNRALLHSQSSARLQRHATTGFSSTYLTNASKMRRGPN